MQSVMEKKVAEKKLAEKKQNTINANKALKPSTNIKK
jgi:hypothetical protein